ncbi:MAG: hypothetical protein ABI992_10785 [Chthoniobacterales bacterium]
MKWAGFLLSLLVASAPKLHLAYTLPFYARAIDAILRDAKTPAAILVVHSNGVLAAVPVHT